MSASRLVLKLDEGRAQGTLEAHDEDTRLWSLSVAVSHSRDVTRLRERARALLQQPIDGLPEVVHFVVEGEELLVASRRIVGARPLMYASADAETRLVQAAEILDRVAGLPEIARTHGALEAASVRLSPSGRLVIEGWVEGPGGDPADDRRALLRIARSLRLVHGDDGSDDDVERDATCVALIKRALARGPSRVVGKSASGGGFDAALGAALAGSEDSTRAVTAAVRVRARAEARGVPTPSEAPPPASVKPAETSMEPTRPRRTSRVGFIVVGLALTAAAVSLVRHREPAVPVPRVPSVSPPKRAQSDVPAAAPVRIDPPSPPSDVTPVTPASKHVHPRTARLSIQSDSAAAIYIDGGYRADVPAELALSPGHHVVRLEAVHGGLQLLPREESIELSPGEHRAISIDLR